MIQDLKIPSLAPSENPENNINSASIGDALLVDSIPLITAIFEDSPDCVAIYTNDTSIFYANKSFNDADNYSFQQTRNSSHAPSEGFQIYNSALNNVLTTGQSTTFLLDRKPSNVRHHIHDIISMTAIKNQNQAILGVIAIGRNLDDYRHNQYQMLAQKERYQRALIDNFPFMVWLKDVDSRFLAINNAYAQLIGVTDSEEVLGKSDYDYFPKADADGFVAFDHEVLQTGESKVVVESITN